MVAAVVRHVGPSLERLPRDAGVANSSTGSVAATESSDGEAILSTFFTAVTAVLDTRTGLRSAL